MRIRIHRGTHQVGGTCVELESQGKRIILDIGLPLDSEPFDVPLPSVSGFSEPDSSLLGIFISHPHLDHYGLYSKVHKEVPIMIGDAAQRIIKAAGDFIPGDFKFNNTIEIKNKALITIGPFTLTPFLVDHSAYDAYALLVEADGQKLFYSGDFRAHGRKGVLLERLISNPPKKIDVMLMEGTTLGRTGKDDKYPSESKLENKFIEIFKETKGMVLIWCSGQNIDRLVTIYRACKRSRRQFVADMYTAHILRSIGNPNLPQPGFPNYFVYLPWTQKQTIIKNEKFELSNSFRTCRIYPEQLKEESNHIVMLFRPSMKTDLERADCLSGATLIYSLWFGYLKQEQYRPFLEWLKEKSIPLMHCHTSGHAPVADLKRLADALNPKMLVPIHTFEPDKYFDYFQNVVLKNDGEWWEVGRT
jgi:ribonuclease J